MALCTTEHAGSCYLIQIYAYQSECMLVAVNRI